MKVSSQIHYLFISTLLAACSGGGGGKSNKDEPAPQPPTKGPLQLSVLDPHEAYNGDLINVQLGQKDIKWVRVYAASGNNVSCPTDASLYHEKIPSQGQFDVNIATLTDGPARICVLAYDDAAKGWQKEASQFDIVIDRTPPATATLVNSPAAITNARNFHLQVQSPSQDLAAYAYSFTVTPTTVFACSRTVPTNEVAASQPIDYTPPANADGRSIQLCLYLKDKTGNWSKPQQATWSWDITPPVLVLQKSPTAQKSGPTPLEIKDPLTYQSVFAKLVANDSECATDANYQALVVDQSRALIDTGAREGDIKLCLYGVDLAGNKQDLHTVRAVTWTVDNTAPVARLSDFFTRTNLLNPKSLTVDGSDTVSYRWAQVPGEAGCDDAPYSNATPVSTPLKWTFPNHDGSYKLCLLGSDAAGNWQDAKNATFHLLTLDREPPVLNILPTSVLPDPVSSLLNFTIDLDKTDVQFYRFAVRSRAAGSSDCPTDEGGYSPALSIAVPFKVDVKDLKDGITTLCVRVADDLGNTTPINQAWQKTWEKTTRASTQAVQLTYRAIADGKFTKLPASLLTNHSTLSFQVAQPNAGKTQVVALKYVVTKASCSNANFQQAATIENGDAIFDVNIGKNDTFNLCVIAKEPNQFWQESATSYQIIVDQEPPVPEFFKDSLPAPLNNLNSVLLNARSDATIAAYRYAVVAGSTCPEADKYGQDTLINGITFDLKDFPQGPVVACLIARDKAGNWSTTPASYSWVRDTIAPQGRITLRDKQQDILAGSQTVVNKTSMDFTFTSNSTDFASYRGYLQYMGSNTPVCDKGLADYKDMPTGHVEFTNQGLYVLCLLGRDQAGNVQDIKDVSLFSFNVDTIGPIPTFSSMNGLPGANQTTNGKQFTASVQKTSDIKAIRFQLVNGACPTKLDDYRPAQTDTNLSLDVSALNDGRISLCIVASDALDNWTKSDQALTFSWNKDTVAPKAPEPEGTWPTLLSASSSQFIVKESEANLTYLYQIVYNAGDTCTPGSGGSYTSRFYTFWFSSSNAVAARICLQARDIAGNTSTVFEHKFTIDTTPPVATLVDPPSGLVKKNTVTSAFVDNNITAYKYKIGNANACPSGGYTESALIAGKLQITFPVEGSITLCLLGKDQAGNWQPESAPTIYSWTISTNAPIAALKAPASAFNTSTPSFTVDAGEVVSYAYRYQPTSKTNPSTACEQAPWSITLPISSPTIQLSGLGDGYYMLCLRGTDSENRPQLQPSLYYFTVDTLKPTKPTNTTTVASALKDSQIVLQLKSSDTNLKEFAYDLAADHKACAVSKDLPTINAVSNISTALTLPLTGEGPQQVCIWARDIAGNLSDALNIQWIRDVTAPAAVALEGLPEAVSNQTSFVLQWTTPDVALIRYSVAKGASVPCDAQKLTSTLRSGESITLGDQGPRTLCYLAEDAAGNRQNASTIPTFTWMYDSLAPVVTIADVPASTNKDLNLQVGPTGDVVGYRYALIKASDNLPEIAAYSPEQKAAQALSVHFTAEGSYRLLVIGRDQVGNWQPVSAPSVFTIAFDVTPIATLNVVGIKDGIGRLDAVPVTVTGDDLRAVLYKFGEADKTTCEQAEGYLRAELSTSSVSFSLDQKPLAQTTVRLCVVGIDAAGNRQDLTKASVFNWEHWTGKLQLKLVEKPLELTGRKRATFKVIDETSNAKTFKYWASTSRSACDNPINYTNSGTIGTAFTYSASASSDYYICILGQDKTGALQDIADAVIYKWSYTNEDLKTAFTVTGKSRVNGNAATGADRVPYTLTPESGKTLTFARIKKMASSDSCNSSKFEDEYSPLSVQPTVGVLDATDNGDVYFCISACDEKYICATKKVSVNVKRAYDGSSRVYDLPSTNEQTPVSVFAPTVYVNYDDNDRVGYEVFEKTLNDCSESKNPVWSALKDKIGFKIRADYYGPVSACVHFEDTWGNRGAPKLFTWNKIKAIPSIVWDGATNAGSSIQVQFHGLDFVNKINYAYQPASAGSCASIDPAQMKSVGVSYWNTSVSIPTTGVKNESTMLCLLACNAWNMCQDISQAKSYTFQIDTTPPDAQLEITEVPADFSTKSEVQFYVKDAADVAFVKYAFGNKGEDCSNLGTTEVKATAQIVISTNEDGPKTLCLFGGDGLKNYQAQPTRFKWTKDSTFPTISYVGFSGPADDSYLNQQEVKGPAMPLIKQPTVTDVNLDSVGYQLTQETSACEKLKDWKAESPKTDNPLLQTEGRYKVCVKALDKASNVAYSYTSYPLTVDLTPPQPIEITSPTAKERPDAMFVLKGRSNEVGTVLISYENPAELFARMDATAYNQTTTEMYTVETGFSAKIFFSAKAGPRTLTLTLKDRAGNLSEPRKFTYTYTQKPGLQRFDDKAPVVAQSASYMATASKQRVTVYRRVEGLWKKIASLTSPLSDKDSGYGNALALTDKFLFVGNSTAKVGDTSQAGTVHIYGLNGDDVTFLRKDLIIGSNQRQGDDRFGYAIAVDDDLLAISSVPDYQLRPSYVFVYRLNADGAWVYDARLGDGSQSTVNGYGDDVEVRNGLILTGDTTATWSTDMTGVLYLYSENVNGWNADRRWLGQGGFGSKVMLKSFALGDHYVAAYDSANNKVGLLPIKDGKFGSSDAIQLLTLDELLDLGGYNRVRTVSSMAFHQDELLLGMRDAPYYLAEKGLLTIYGLNEKKQFELQHSLRPDLQAGLGTRVGLNAAGLFATGETEGVVSIDRATIDATPSYRMSLETEITVDNKGNATWSFADPGAIKNFQVMLPRESNFAYNVTITHPDGTKAQATIAANSMSPPEAWKAFADKPLIGEWSINTSGWTGKVRIYTR